MYNPAVSDVPLPPEIDRLTSFEKKYAVPVYCKWMAIFTSDRPDQEEDNKRRALNGAYFTAGRFWFRPTILFSIPGSFIFSVWHSLLGVVLLGAAGVFMCVALWRSVQALNYYPHLSMRRIHLSEEHPDPYS